MTLYYPSVREAGTGSTPLLPEACLARFKQCAEQGYACAAAYWLTRYIKSTPLPTLHISYRNVNIPEITLESMSAETIAYRKQLAQAEAAAEALKSKLAERREFYGLPQR